MLCMDKSRQQFVIHPRHLGLLSPEAFANDQKRQYALGTRLFYVFVRHNEDTAQSLCKRHSDY